MCEGARGVLGMMPPILWPLWKALGCTMCRVPPSPATECPVGSRRPHQAVSLGGHPAFAPLLTMILTTGYKDFLCKTTSRRLNFIFTGQVASWLSFSRSWNGVVQKERPTHQVLSQSSLAAGSSSHSAATSVRFYPFSRSLAALRFSVAILTLKKFAFPIGRSQLGQI